jgi:DNA-binding MarR family transcriptional regulator
VTEPQRVRDAIRVLARISRQLETADSGLTLPQYRMLSALSDGGQRSARLAERLAIRKPTATALADGLVAAGYAERESEPGDRRIVRLRITPTGEAALARADDAFTATIGPLLNQVPDPAALVEALLAFGHAIDARAEELAAAQRAAVTEGAR